ncbi:MAG TPA: serine hydrolase domain-containing protein [Candidatus Dormibacteraeota bacterium]|nr:serine hydrolase domain-containing protein [Candidatus Dormibacteraeota bacterium]
MSPRMLAALSTVVVLLFGGPLAGSAWAEPLPRATPEQVGLSSERLGHVSRVLGEEILKGKLPGAVALVARRGRIAYYESFGVRDPETRAPMTKDSIFRIYSMTKPITSVAIMMLQEEGRLVLTDPVSKSLPQLTGLQVAVEKKDAATGQVTYELQPARREITIQDLLRHTSGFTYGGRTTNAMVKEAYAKAGVDARDLTNAELVQRLATVPLAHQPGTAWEYSRSVDVLGRVVEVISGKSLGGFFAERIFTPLAMKDSGFFVAKDKLARVAQAFPVDPATGEKIALIDVTAQPKYESGGGGGVSTADDYIRFAQMLLNGGRLNGTRLLSRTTVAFMASDHLGATSGTMGAPGQTFGLGFSVRKDAGLAGQSGSIGEYGWAGAGGTYFWIDPKEQLIAILMTQAPGPSRTYYRQLFKELVQQALAD